MTTCNLNHRIVTNDVRTTEFKFQKQSARERWFAYKAEKAAKESVKVYGNSGGRK
jgi:hypothetical protein